MLRAGGGGWNLSSSSRPSASWRWPTRVRACLCVRVVESVCENMWRAWLCERAPAFIKSVAPALTFTPPPKCFVVFICLPSDTDSIPPPSVSAVPLPTRLAEGEDSFTAPLLGKRSTVRDTHHQPDSSHFFSGKKKKEQGNEHINTSVTLPMKSSAVCRHYIMPGNTQNR